MKGEAAVLVKFGRPVARIAPVSSQAQVSGDLIAFLRQWRVEHPEPDEQFADATLNIREFQRVTGLRLVDVSAYTLP